MVCVYDVLAGVAMLEGRVSQSPVETVVSCDERLQCPLQDTRTSAEVRETLHHLWNRVSKKKVESSMTRSLIVENLLPQNVESIINYLQLCYWSSSMGSSTLQSTTTSYGQWRQKTEDRIDWTLPPTLHRAAPHELHVLHGENAGSKSHDLLHLLGSEHATFGMLDKRTACAAGHSGLRHLLILTISRLMLILTTLGLLVIIISMLHHYMEKKTSSAFWP